MNLTRKSFLLGAVVAATLIGASAPAIASDAVKAAGVLPGAITDQAFNQSVYEGLLRAESDLGVEIAYSEKVAQADQASAMMDYVRRDYDVVIGAGGEFTDAAKRVLDRFPDANIVVLNGAPEPGITTLNFNNYQIGYLLGFIGGHTTKTGKGAMISAAEIAAFVELREGYKAGWAVGSPDGEVLSALTSDWADVAKAKEIALSLAGQGADVMLPYLDAGVVGVLQAAEDKGLKVTNVLGDLAKTHPEINLASVVLDYSAATVMAIDMARNGTLSGENELLAVGSKAAYLGSMGNTVAPDIRTQVEEIASQMAAGTFEQ